MEDMTTEVRSYISKQEEFTKRNPEEIIRSLGSFLTDVISPDSEWVQKLDWIDEGFLALVEKDEMVIESRNRLSDVRKHTLRGNEDVEMKKCQISEWLALLRIASVDTVTDTAA